MIRKVITIHCSDTVNGKRVDVSEIRKWHLDRGFSDVGYHFLIQPSDKDNGGAEIQLGRPLNKPGAHVQGFNRIQPGNIINIGICMIGRDQFTSGQFDLLRRTLDNLFGTYTIDPWAIWCHYEWESANGKTCPNMRASNLHSWYWLHDYEAIFNYVIKEK